MHTAGVWALEERDQSRCFSIREMGGAYSSWLPIELVCHGEAYSKRKSIGRGGGGRLEKSGTPPTGLSWVSSSFYAVVVIGSRWCAAELMAKAVVVIVIQEQ